MRRLCDDTPTTEHPPRCNASEGSATHARRDATVTNSTDKQTDRKVSAALASDDAIYETTPFGRRRKPPASATIFYRILHVIAFPFFYVYDQFKSRARTREQKWADARGHHGAKLKTEISDDVR